VVYLSPVKPDTLSIHPEILSILLILSKMLFLNRV